MNILKRRTLLAGLGALSAAVPFRAGARRHFT